MKKIAITGGIASGKSTLCHWLTHDYHLPVFDADATVHRLYRHPVVCEMIALLFPACMHEDGTVSRTALAHHISNYPDALEVLEDLFHPLVRRQEALFWQRCIRQGYDIAFSDIPLLFETRSASRYDAVIVADSPAWLRYKRALRRPHMSEAKWRSITRRQVTDAARKKKADILIHTSIGKAYTIHQLDYALTLLRN